jgi:DNA helicase-2/ATP-dependent DNA helicase PcrA
LVLAGPGSGKTRVLTERVRRLVADPLQHFRVLALTFTNKAANEMIERLDDVPDIRTRAFVGTIHSFCMEVLANRGKPVGVDGLPHIFESFEDRRQILLDGVSADPDLLHELTSSGAAKDQQKVLAQWLERISELKGCLLLPAMIENDFDRMLCEAYDSQLRASGAIDYDDLLLLTHQLFTERPKIAEFYQRQYRYICIDEAQDLNEAQYRLLCALCGTTFRNIMMVGDVDQAIYGWNGSDPKYLQMFQRDFSAKRIALADNFRCAKAIVEAAKRLNPSYVVRGQVPINGLVQTIVCADERDEAHRVVQTLSSLLSSGHPDIEGSVTWDQCAVIGRNRFMFTELERLLKEKGIPYFKKLSASAHHSESSIVEELELAFRLLANSRDRFHCSLLTKAWGIPPSITTAGLVGLDLIETMAKHATQGAASVITAAIREMRWSVDDFRLLPALNLIGQYASTVSDERTRELVLNDLKEWRKCWDHFVRNEPGGEHSLALFLSQIALGTTQQARDPGLGLLTIHSSKGMEFDVVVLIGMVEGGFPDYRATGKSLAEEARSAFVAVTRSRRLLYLTYPQVKKMPWGDLKSQSPSRYLGIINPS